MSNITEPTKSIFDARALPPWGHLSPEFISGINLKQGPKDWLKTTAESSDARRKHFEEWSERTLARIKHILWPVFDPSLQAWVGDSVASMEELCKADLHLMAGLSHKLDDSPESPLRPLTLKTHFDLFEVEDQNGGADLLANYDYYDRTQGIANLEAIRHSAVLANGTKIGNVGVVLKTNLQRPRPVQMAIRFGFSDFKYHEATTSLSPSMCSNHALQSSLDVGGAIEFAATHLQLQPDTKAALGQWGVDIGDRRVFAGVHYPSDNLCSWITFLRMADFVYSRPEPKEVIADAIVNHSYVFQKLKNLAGSPEGEYHRKAVKEVEYLAGLPYDPDRPLDRLDRPKNG